MCPMVVSGLSPVVSGLSAVREHQGNALPAAPNEHADATGAQGFPTVLMCRRRMILSVLSSKKQKKNISVKKCFCFIGLRAPDRRKNLKRKGFFARIRFQRAYG